MCCIDARLALGSKILSDIQVCIRAVPPDIVRDLRAIVPRFSALITPAVRNLSLLCCCCAVRWLELHHPHHLVLLHIINS